MNPIPPTNRPETSSSYVPYFYERGLFQVYDMPQQQRRYGAQSFSTAADQVDRPVPFSRSLDRAQTVEQIIANGYFAAPAGDPVTAILSDKEHTSWLGLDDVISQIRKRHEIYDRHIYQIELGKCAAMNALYSAEAYHGPADSKQFYSRHKRLQELYEQERNERTSLWKDISRLRQALPESAQMYLGARRGLQALQDTGGDLA